jgi:hypothetical protein
MVSCSQFFPPKPYVRLSCLPYALHAPLISFFSILSPKKNEKNAVPIEHEAWWAQGPDWTGGNNFVSHLDSISGPFNQLRVAISTDTSRPPHWRTVTCHLCFSASLYTHVHVKPITAVLNSYYSFDLISFNQFNISKWKPLHCRMNWHTATEPNDLNNEVNQLIPF